VGEQVNAVSVIALLLAILAFVLVSLVLIGIRRESPWSVLGTKPPTRLAAFARVVLGVYVCKIDDQPSGEITSLAKGRR
jgi:hypothetical protein